MENDKWREPTTLEDKIFREAFEVGWKAHLNKNGLSLQEKLAKVMRDLKIRVS